MASQVALSTSARTLLEAAAARDDHLAVPPSHLPIAAQRSVVQSLLKAGLIEEADAGNHQPTWRTADAGERYALRATQAGLEAVGIGVGGEYNLSSGADGSETAETVPTAATRADAAPTSAATRVEARQSPNLRAAAQALLQAWDATGNGPLWMAPHFDALRAAVTVVRAKEGSPSRRARPCSAWRPRSVSPAKGASRGREARSVTARS